MKVLSAFYLIDIRKRDMGGKYPGGNTGQGRLGGGGGEGERDNL